MDRKTLKEISESTSEWNLRKFLDDLLREITLIEKQSESSEEYNDFTAEQLVWIKNSLEWMQASLKNSLSVDDVISFLDEKSESLHDSIDWSKEQIDKLKKVLSNRDESRKVILRAEADRSRSVSSQQVMKKAQSVYVGLDEFFSNMWRVWTMIMSFISYLYSKAWIDVSRFFDKHV